MRADFPLDKKTVENQDWVTGLRGCRGPRAARPSGCRVAGPWRAMGRESLGRRGPWAASRWAAGLLLAKPADKRVIICALCFIQFVV